LKVPRGLGLLSEDIGTGLSQEYRQLAAGLQALLQTMRPWGLSLALAFWREPW